MNDIIEKFELSDEEKNKLDAEVKKRQFIWETIDLVKVIFEEHHNEFNL